MLRDSAITGFTIDGDAERLVTTLFADDTTVYLSQEDEFSYLMEILKTWCRTSGAKFNENKTILIPVGSKEYRTDLIRSRKMTDDGEEIPAECEITEDGKPVRVLGAFVGNEVLDLEVWAPTLEKIDQRLHQWAKSHPTQDGRCIIINIVVGGLTQYLTRVQGMSKEVEEKIIKKIRTFMWDGKSAMVSLEVMYGDIADGGKRLLDLKSRNEAIELIKLRTYLNEPKKRPRWASIADELIARTSALSQGVSDELKVNTFLQSWTAYTTARSALPAGLRKMLSVAAKHNVTIDPPLVAKEVRRAMPAWYH
ncbi:hypothetical protein CPC08DRAFT_698610, partial [Agrocybe pediades]